jgi:hypothetical protein
MTPRCHDIVTVGTRQLREGEHRKNPRRLSSAADFIHWDFMYCAPGTE